MKSIITLLLLLSFGLVEAQGWDAYSSKIDTFEAIISCDLALRLQPVDETRPWAMVVEFRVKKTDERGFPLRKEWDMLNKIEDTLASAMAAANGLYVGRTVYNGKKQLFFYLRDTSEGMAAVDPLLKTLSPFKSGRQIQPDPEWQYYHQFLFPQPKEFNGILNQRQLADMQAEGDRLVQPRMISHWAYFETETDRDMYKDRMQTVKFRIDKEVRTTGEGDFPFAIKFTRKDLPDLNLLNDLTWQLYKLAEKYGGKYEGWECEVVME